MKRIVLALLVALICASARPAKAQYFPPTYCCDGNDIKRCLIPPGPTGLVCSCYGVLGSGISCW